MTTKGRIIFLNGTSSSGKTTLARVLQAALERPTYHLAYDTFNQMVSQKHRNTDYWAITNITVSAMHHTVALFSDLGLDVIVDHVILDTRLGQAWLRECVQLWHTHPVLFVRVECPLEELERREQLRAGRRPGQARAQIDQIHGHGYYDLTVDTYTQTIEMCAEQIRAALVDPVRWTAFQALYQRWIAADSNTTRSAPV